MAAVAVALDVLQSDAAAIAAAVGERPGTQAAQSAVAHAKLAELLASVDLDDEQAERTDVNALIDDVLDRCRNAAAALEGRQSLVQISDHLGILLDAAEAVEDARARDVIEHLILEYVDAQSDKVDAIADYLAHCEERAEGARREKARLDKRRATYERRIESLKSYINTFMQYRNCAKLEGEHVTFTRHRCPESVEILDEKSVPYEYCKIVLEPSKTLLKPALKAGPVAGALLVTDKYSVRRA